MDRRYEKEDWEDVDFNTTRLKIKGGWLVRYAAGAGAGLTFVPDKNHSWKLKKVSNE